MSYRKYFRLIHEKNEITALYFAKSVQGTGVLSRVSLTAGPVMSMVETPGASHKVTPPTDEDQNRRPGTDWMELAKLVLHAIEIGLLIAAFFIK